ncbi:hypothetical protein L6252_01755 [Candidatus Parcubacteria bacterium]|nr:hypothetical protein [Candidatus Parcubacteria bacterium]
MQQDRKEIVKKIETINRVDREYLQDVLFGGKDPFASGINIDKIYQKCVEALTVEALLSAD